MEGHVGATRGTMGVLRVVFVVVHFCLVRKNVMMRERISGVISKGEWMMTLHPGASLSLSDIASVHS